MKDFEFDKQFRQFTDESARAGLLLPDPSQKLAVLNEDHKTHTGNDFSWDYLLHCAWAARMLAKNKPKRHLDFGSYAYFTAICAPFVNCEFYDIRPLGIEVPGLGGGAADLTALPFADNSLMSLSCLHVLEHVGLGRYGDELDAFGHKKAASELSRVLAPGGSLLIVLPMNETPRINFNAHRILSSEMAAELFAGLTLTESIYLYAQKFHDKRPLNSQHDYTGCFEFTK